MLVALGICPLSMTEVEHLGATFVTLLRVIKIGQISFSSEPCAAYDDLTYAGRIIENDHCNTVISLYWKILLVDTVVQVRPERV